MRLPQKFDGRNKEALAEAEAVLGPSREGDSFVGDIQLQALWRKKRRHCLVGK
jgi:hypothetical protein